MKADKTKKKGPGAFANDWESVLERRLRDDLDAFLADEDDVAFEIPSKTARRRAFEFDAARPRNRSRVVVVVASVAFFCGVLGFLAEFREPAPSGIGNVPTSIARGKIELSDVDKFAAFNDFSNFDNKERRDALAICGVGGFVVADAAFRRSSELAEVSFQRVGEWRAEKLRFWRDAESAESNDAVPNENAANEFCVNGAENETTGANETKIEDSRFVGTLLKTDPVIYLVDEIYLSNSETAHSIFQKFQKLNID